MDSRRITIALNQSLFMRIALTISLILFCSLSIADHGMKQESMERIVKAMAVQASGEKGVVEFVYQDVRMYLISDIRHNRMRIVAPVADYTKLTRLHLDAVLESNYHKSQDARYAVSKDVLYAVFIHSMAELHEGQIRSAVQQAANLALTFGSEYSSGELTLDNQDH